MTEVTSIPQEKIVQIGSTVFHLRHADLLRPLTDGEREGLRASIEHYGIQQGVTVVSLSPPDAAPNEKHYEVIDGGHRVEIADELDFTAAMIPLNFADPNFDAEQKRALAISLNFDRRHMPVEERRQRAAELRAQGQSYRQIGAALGVSQVTARADVQAAGVKDLTPDAITGKDGKAYPAVDPEPPEQMIEFARALIPAALLTWTKPVEAGHIARQVRKEPGAEHIAVKAVKMALARMVEAGNVVKLKNDAGRTVYALAHDPAIENPPQAGESPAPEETPAPATTPEAAKRAILEALAGGPRDLIALRETGWLPDVPPARFADYTIELINAGSIRRDAARPYEVFELVPDTAAQSAAWLDQQVSKHAPPEQAQTQTAKDAELISSHLPEGHGRHLSSLRAATGLDKDRFHRALNLLEADGKVVRQVDQKIPANTAVIRAELVKPEPAPAPEDDIPNAGAERESKADNAITELRFALLFFVSLSDADIEELATLRPARLKNVREQMGEIMSLTTTRMADTMRRINLTLSERKG